VEAAQRREKPPLGELPLPDPTLGRIGPAGHRAQLRVGIAPVPSTAMRIASVSSSERL
jgi:hypothetical protein